MVRVQPTRWEVRSDTPGNERRVVICLSAGMLGLDAYEYAYTWRWAKMGYPTLRAALRVARKFVKEGEPHAQVDP